MKAKTKISTFEKCPSLVFEKKNDNFWRPCSFVWKLFLEKNFGRQFYFLKNISIFQENCHHHKKMFIFEENVGLEKNKGFFETNDYFWRKLQFFTLIVIFQENVYFLKWISVFEENIDFSMRISVCNKNISFRKKWLILTKIRYNFRRKRWFF